MGNHVAPGAMPELLQTVAASLRGLVQPQAQAEPEIEKPSPAQIRKSITDEGLVSFLDGKRYQILKRHLATHGLTPQAYRERYGLPADYPMTAPAYGALRAELAKARNLGRRANASE